MDYSLLDEGKRLALGHALSTSQILSQHGARAFDASRGEPAFVFQLGELTLAFVLEGLGTKSMIARAVWETTGENHYDAVAYDAVAAIVNDLSCVGALPMVVNAYFATGSSAWYQEPARVASLLDGWRRACEDASCTWGGGESPSLPGLLADKDIELAGSAVGVVPSGADPLFGQDLASGDEIVFVESSGLHANGATLARSVAERLPHGYETPVPPGGTLGSALLEPTYIYVGLVRRLLAAGLPVTYLSHITGHGLLKIMRPQRDLTYRITRLPSVPIVLRILASEMEMDAHTAYRTLNMGVGFAVYCRSGVGTEIVKHARAEGLQAAIMGRVEDGPRRVILEPVDVIYESEDMKLSLDTHARGGDSS